MCVLHSAEVDCVCVIQRALDIREDSNSSLGSTISNLGLSSDNKRPSPHTPIKHEEKRRSPGLESWQPNHPSDQKV